MEIKVINKEECYVKKESTEKEELNTVIRMSVQVAGFDVDARLFAPSLPESETVEVTSHTGNIG